MPVDADPIEIVICLGSSCFARGNSQNLAVIQQFLESHDLKASVRFSGKLCQDECTLGPNLMVSGQSHHEVTPAKLRNILQQLANRPTEAQ
jgi:NADH:ubiquinone oxidoreductase subunit E